MDQQSLFMSFKSSKTLIKKGTHLVGFGFDGTACFRKGARLGPSAIREASYGVETFSPYLNLDLDDTDKLYDLGDLDLGNSQNPEEKWKQGNQELSNLWDKINLKKDEIKLLTLGGEHSISYAPIKKYLEDYSDLLLIHLDAHADLRDGYEGFHYSHASIMRRALDHFEKGHDLVQYGIRSGTKSEYKWMREKGTLQTSKEDFFSFIRSIPNERPLYLTLDLDYFDPSYFPGTGTPEPGGEDFHSFIKLMKILRGKNIVGADVVELAPDLDSSGNSSVFAAKVVREIGLLLTQNKLA